MLKKKDPKRAQTIDSNNKVRLIRALEIVGAIGKVPPLGNPVSKWQFIYVGIKPDDLEKRIEKRVKKMFRLGLLREIENLKKARVTNKRLKELGFEYFNPTPEGVISETLNYAKRQMTWFKRDKEIKWFDPKAVAKIEKRVRGWLKK